MPRDRATDDGHTADAIAAARGNGQGELRPLDRAVVAVVVLYKAISDP
ncbi:Potential Pseudomonas putida clc transposon [Bordetella petrii]|uniref:Potential Pseudomonas putida clc transposon n=1 Tax=Bordetella petrii (strain ATCC BAA-461 / DSM 12804 / CCUG 43448 / CIP 107267 / Se-1111R) TaxID=340100 RepID=A9IFV2_BORPD|nr:Potential Pseudomonas putida clc transposon [Bordetella petrii]